MSVKSHVSQNLVKDQKKTYICLVNFMDLGHVLPICRVCFEDSVAQSDMKVVKLLLSISRTPRRWFQGI